MIKHVGGPRAQKAAPMLALAALAVASVAAAQGSSASGQQPGATPPLFLPRPLPPLFQDNVKWTPEKIRDHVPSTPNPYLSFLPVEAEVEWDFWAAKAALEGAEREAARPADRRRAVAVADAEPNNDLATAQPVPGFGTGPGLDPLATLTGSLSAGAPAPFAESENNDSIPNADVAGAPVGTLVQATGAVGGGGAANGNNDVDFYQFTGSAGDFLSATVNLQGLSDSVMFLFDSAGNELAFDDDDGPGLGSLISGTLPADGTYYLAVGSYNVDIPNPLTGAGTSGGDSSGVYRLDFGLNTGDTDVFAVDLVAGDILGAALSGTASVAVLDPAGVLRMGSASDLSFIYPAESTLPGGGSSVAYVAAEAGTHFIVATAGTGNYTIQARVDRPVLERSPARAVQYLFIDFNGATVNAAATVGGNNPAVLSPLSSFLGGWGIPANQESLLIDGIMANLEESMNADFIERGNNGARVLSSIDGEFDIVLLNSRDHPDPFGLPNVSRVIVGGTISQLGVSTIGIAESIDPGNYGTEETAFVLLDLLSAAASDGNSLNQFPLAPGVTRRELVAEGVGNITAHEAGHFLGGFHTNQFNEVFNIQDQGGNLPAFVGLVGGAWGDGDEADVDFVPDVYVSNEGLLGTQDLLQVIAFGMSTGTTAGADYNLVTGEVRHTGAGTADSFTVTPSGSNVLVVANGQPSTLPAFAGYAASSVVIDARGGNDFVSVTPSTTQPIEVLGGDQNDVLAVNGLGEAVLDNRRLDGAVALSGGYEPVAYQSIEVLDIQNTRPELDPVTPQVLRAGSVLEGVVLGQAIDLQDSPGQMSVSILQQPTGVTIANLRVEAQGVLADLQVDCSRFSGIGTLRLLLTDSDASTDQADVIFQFQPNPAPTLGQYSAASVAAGGSALGLPDALPSDANGNLASVAVTPTVLPGGGTVEVDPLTGIVTFQTTGATPTGDYQVLVTATDSCGAPAQSLATLQVTAGVSGFMVYE